MAVLGVSKGASTDDDDAAGWPPGGDRQSRVRAVYVPVFRRRLFGRRLRRRGQAGGRLRHLGAAR
eukprot:scaffold127223_cov75-Phaeocystis_antarctica.AAC.1